MTWSSAKLIGAWTAEQGLNERSADIRRALLHELNPIIRFLGTKVHLMGKTARITSSKR